MEAVLSQKNKTLEFLGRVDATFNKVNHSVLKGKIDAAKQRLEEYDLPGRRQEDWKYSKITPVFNREYSEQRSNKDYDLSKWSMLNEEHNLLVFVNGFYRDDLSKIIFHQEGVIIQNITEAVDLFSEDVSKHYQADMPDSFFSDLNSCYHANGVFVKVDDNVIAEKPIHVLHILDGDNCISQARSMVLVGKNAKVEILESQVEEAANASLSNHVTEFYIEENGILNYNLIEKGSDNVLLHHNYFHQADHSKINSNTFTLANKLTRNMHYAFIAGADTETRLNGSFMPAKGEQIDNRTMLNHQNLRGYSEEVYKGILYDDANAVFNGKIFVDQKAQQTNAYLNNSNILMHDSAKMHSKPELEIYADDVRCSHGSATGDFDSEAQFYLQARGLGEESAKNMLIHAFMDEVAMKIENEEIQELAKSYLDDRMQQLK